MDTDVAPASGFHPVSVPAFPDRPAFGSSSRFDPETIVAGLTPAQAQAVRHTEGPLLVLAGPGSGKTRVITRRIAYLIACGIPAYQILAVTFTNKAAAEMRERTEKLLGVEHNAGGERRGGGAGAAARGLTVTTFHALCARLLRKYADRAALGGPGGTLTGTFVIYDTDDQTALIKRALDTLNLSSTNWPARSVLSRISAAKNELLDVQAFTARAADFNTRTIAKIYAEYQKGLRAANAVDFDDLLLLTAQMLASRPEIRGECQARWRYLLVDEYQDTNRAQFVIASLIAGAGPGAGPSAGATAAPSTANICVVGDPDQSIYGWRGADIANILDFETQFPGATIIPLGENFRSTKNIIAAADRLIRNNTRRKHKDLHTANPVGEKVEAVLLRDEHHEAAHVVQWLRGVREEARDAAGEGGRGANWKDYAVFYRTNALSRVMEDRLRGEGIPYVIARGTAFYQREEIKNALAYLRVVANPADEVSLLRIINTPTRGLGDTSVEKARAFAAQRGVNLLAVLREPGPLALAARTAGACQKFVAMLDAFTGGGDGGLGQGLGQGLLHTAAADGSLAELVERVVRESGLEQMYRDQANKSGTDADAERLANLDELISSARDFETTYDPANDPGADAPLDPDAPVPTPTLFQLLRAYLERVTLVADADSVDPTQGAVTLMTLHAAKGLEFHGAALIGLEEAVLPHSRVADSPGELEEERRLFFVGITRAMHRLLITSARYRTVRGIMERTIPSRFLSELPKDNVSFTDRAGDDADWDREDDADRGPRGRAGRGGRDELDDGPAMPARPASTRTKDSRGVPIEVGALVRHPQFGVGRVVSVTPGADARAQIRFQEVGVKTLVLQFARLERVS